MRAITVSSYGARPSVTELPTPQAGPGQVLIATRAAGMNPMDLQIANGGWQDRVPATFPMVLGADLAGTVRAGGPGAARFAPGDAVFGQLLIPPLGSAGTYAQYVAVAQDAPLARIPAGLDPVTAAALPTAGVTALQITESLARAGVTGVNFALSMTVPRLDRLAARVAAGSIVPPPITRISLDDVPAVLENPTHPKGKTVITM
jgi:NADPH:quinone reductase-like Zn-dependent oxidoreductase